MAKPITCESRNAREFCLERAGKTGQNTSNYSGYDECWKILCQKVIGNSNVWITSESEPIFFSETYDWITVYGSFQNVTKSIAEFWLYNNRIFIESDGIDYTQQERKLLILEEFDKERRQFEKLHAKFSGIPNATQNRSKIPSHVRIFVWQRDSGKCVECGSNENLEYDHIIPFIKGGSNTERNLQLLCGNYNRLKSDSIQ